LNGVMEFAGARFKCDLCDDTNERERERHAYSIFMTTMFIRFILALLFGIIRNYSRLHETIFQSEERAVNGAMKELY
jgi:hypothetical protein